MKHTEILTRYVGNFVDELVASGLRDVIISPGSRSTPLAMTFVQHSEIKEWILVDERSAAFFALGLAKETKRPVALVCTSGTAAANYFPAIVEAYYSRVPLIVLTADRPHELRDVGAPQAIEQIKMFGEYVKWFHEMALPEATDSMLIYVRRAASRAVQTAKQDIGGPVHLNFPFREPLVPDFTLDDLWGERNEIDLPFSPYYDGQKQLNHSQLTSLLHEIKEKRGILVVGPQADERLAEVIIQLAAYWHVPILADPLSQLRTGNHRKEHIIEGYDAFLRHQSIRNELKPDFIIRFGAMPISKAYLFYLKENKDIPQFIVEPYTGYREPVGNPTHMVYSDPISFCQQIMNVSPPIEEMAWLSKWQKINAITKEYLETDTNDQLTEGNATRTVIEELPNRTILFVGNSMAIRDVDTFLMTNSKQISLLANRGANGIDGVVSSSIGAAATRRRVTLLIGDLSFYHDLNGLLAAKHYELDMTIVLMNNNGGGIFSFLPQSQDNKHFELLFGTPLHIDFKHAVQMYGGTYRVPKTIETLRKELNESYERAGLTVIEVRTDRTENSAWHREKWQAIHDDILQMRWK
ncbi:MAG TPA: 2-succinyl-5-enolpyruvyl-6-hydroxy-3-cyclohexene-1-carboxylic-acid synthase [Cerasibacillus sp.]|uniref:2-succinyl-5-enolpyruvyl-6-hydroxy-3- cyclohexene-1-carboxylic-acid synthase n=1 Tax=Cerasibacillus sp. TaxID=2498711 RepID=UPI002F4102E7